MSALGKLRLDSTTTMTLYADDIALLVGASRPPTAFGRIEQHLDKLKLRVKEYCITFSPTKSQLLSLKGGLKPNYLVGFGTEPNDPKIGASATVKYLGVMLDPRKSYWDHVRYLTDKSKDLYTRLRRMTSAN